MPRHRTCPISLGTCLGAGCARKNKGVEVPGPGVLSTLGFLGCLQPPWEVPPSPGWLLHPKAPASSPGMSEGQQRGQEVRDAAKLGKTLCRNRNSSCSVSCLLPSPSQGPGSATGTCPMCCPALPRVLAVPLGCPNTPDTTTVRDGHLQLHFVPPKHAPESCGWHRDGGCHPARPQLGCGTWNF